MEKPAKASGSKSRDGKRDRASRGNTPHPDALFAQSAEGPAQAPDADMPDTGVMPTALGIEAKLVVEKGVHAGKVLKLSAGTVVIGRSSKCELSLKGASGVSRRHCKVQFIGTQYALIDLESRNGTQVNGITQPRFILKDGDLIEVCDEQLRFVSSGAKEAPAPTGVADINERATQLLDALPRDTVAVENNIDALRDELRADKRDEDSDSDEGPIAGFNAAPPTRADRSRPSLPAPAAQHRTPHAEQFKPDPTASFVMPTFEPVTAALREPAQPPPLPRDEPRRSSRGAQPARARPDDFENDTAFLPPANTKKPGGFRAAHAVLLLLLLLIGAMGAAAWDLTKGDKRLRTLARSFQIEEIPHAPPAKEPDVKEPEVKEPEVKEPEVKEPEVKEPEVKEPEVKEPAPKKEPEAVAPEPDVKEPGAASVAVGDAIEVTARSSGVVTRVNVAPGQALKKGQPILLLESGAGGLRKKLEVLQGEKRDFEAAVRKGMTSAQRDLDAVQAEIAGIERKLRPAALPAPVAGTVLEVLVKPGQNVKAGDIVARLQP